MVELRLILLGIGLAVITAIYLWGIRARIRARIAERRRRRQALVPENEPLLDGQERVSPLPEDEPAPTPPGGISADQTAAVEAIASTAAEQATVSATGRAADSGPAAELESLKPRSEVTGSPGSRVSDPKPAPAPPVEEDSTARSGTADETTARSSKPGRASGGVTTRPAPAHTVPGRPSRSPAGEVRRPQDQGQMTVLLTVMAPAGQTFAGTAVAAVCDDLHLQLSAGGVWECLGDGSGDQRAIFGIAHLREPGTFDREQLAALRTPGLLLFMKLPGPLRAVPAVDRMIAVAGQIARRLGGTVCDDRRSRMNTQGMIRLRSEAAEFERQAAPVDS